MATTPGFVTAKLSLANVANDPVLSTSIQASDRPAFSACYEKVASESRNEAEAIISPMLGVVLNVKRLVLKFCNCSMLSGFECLNKSTCCRVFA